MPVESGVKEAGEGWNVDQMKVVVDRQNGWPLRSTETLAGQFVDEIRLSNLVVDCPPAVLQTFPSDGGFVGVGLDQVDAIVGYRPVLPAPASLPAVTPLSSRDATFMVVPLSFLLLGWGRTVTPAAPARGPGVMTALTEPSAGSFPQGSIGGSEGIAASPRHPAPGWTSCSPFPSPSWALRVFVGLGWLRPHGPAPGLLDDRSEGRR
ncbi:MAG: hypothetical protein QOD63_2464 [Actinomycetota bacterium]|nr:hypothetical protein [Actinomycetota bacterium]